jgi:DeoR family ulaG and ulaABCDEF operon transcriptional repressor
MEADPLIAQAAMKLIDRADEIVVLADSRKLRQRSSTLVVPLERVSTLVTDSGATDQELEPLRRVGVQIVTVEISADDAERSSA